jgi:NAD(P)-dependent dehydrogenase (short-subunit alcohol dehydrogenase family)
VTGGEGDGAIARTLSGIFDVRDRVTLVTGGASGIGLAIAEVMVDCGARVTVADVHERRLAEVGDRLAGRPGAITTAHVDVSDRAAVRRLVDSVVAEHGSLDVAFVNAGISGAGPSAAGDRDAADLAWDRTLAINLTGAAVTLQACGEAMRRHGSGRIVVTASTAGLRADPWVADSYAASKAALVNLTRQAALRLAGHGVNVNAIAPGTFKTNIGNVPGAVRPPLEAIERRWGGTNLLGRRADTDELKGLALLLASPASSFITGGVFPIDGGALINFASAEPWQP